MKTPPNPLSKPASSLRKILLKAAAIGCLLVSMGRGSIVQADALQDSPFEPEIKAFEKKDLASPPAPGGVVFVGSSSIRMWTKLESSFPGVNVINRGFGGSQLADSTLFADRIVLPYKPRMVVLYAGDNDIAAGKSAAQVCSDFIAFTEKLRLKQPDVKIAFISIKPSPSRWKMVDTMRAANQQIKKYISKQNQMQYIDVFTPMLDAEGQPRPELYREDGLHPTEVCYKLWQGILKRYVK